MSPVKSLILLSIASLGIVFPEPIHAQTQGEEWELVWSDEFEGNQLDRTKWKPEMSCWGGGNNERQCYTDRSKRHVTTDCL